MIQSILKKPTVSNNTTWNEIENECVNVKSLVVPYPTVEQDLEHPEGVTCMLRKVCDDGKDRIVTGCLDGGAVYSPHQS